MLFYNSCYWELHLRCYMSHRLVSVRNLSTWYARASILLRCCSVNIVYWGISFSYYLVLCTLGMLTLLANQSNISSQIFLRLSEILTLKWHCCGIVTTFWCCNCNITATVILFLIPVFTKPIFRSIFLLLLFTALMVFILYVSLIVWLSYFLSIWSILFFCIINFSYML